MHELGLMENILDIVRQSAAENGSKKVKKIFLEVGALSGAVPESLLFYLDTCTQGTDLDGVMLEITKREPQAQCRECQTVFDVLKNNFSCPVCKSENWELHSGRELNVTGIEVEER